MSAKLIRTVFRPLEDNRTKPLQPPIPSLAWPWLCENAVRLLCFSRDLGGELMRPFEEADRGQWMLLPACLDDFIDESNAARVIDVFA
ncbi:hypothetical protein [Bradyrhizobium sp. Leo121]|uniref:hypothetical protein n=1 Tax=Bradyrhizobium sp. Leo121 TaxID=1571195 RepID=UPI001029D173|nr:hypothetical protein [Bradyrhizobium sp. Leo121]